MSVEELLSRLSVNEKISLLTGRDFWHTASLPEHGIISIRLSDGPIGVRGTKFFNSVPAACFPCGTALGATWDQDLLLEAGKLMGKESIAKGAHVLLGPTVNIMRSPLGGRGFEFLSEDPILSGLAASAIINGVQGTGITASPEGNTFASVPASCQVFEPESVYGFIQQSVLIQDILRGEWKSEGLMMSDWYGMYSTVESLNAGLDLEMPGPSRYRGNLLVNTALRGNRISPHTIDERAHAILQLVQYCMKSGIPEDAEEGKNDNPETSALLRKIAANSIVLLKNERNVLPLSKSKKTLVIGPNAKRVTSGGGSANLRPYYAITPFEGIQSKISDPSLVTYTLGAEVLGMFPNVATSWQVSDDAKSNQGIIFRAYNEPPGENWSLNDKREHVDEILLDSSSCIFNDYTHPKVNQPLWYATLTGYLHAETTGEYEVGLSVFGSAQLFVNGDLVIDNTKNQKQGTAFFNLGTVEERGSFKTEKGKSYRIVITYGSGPTSTLKGTGADYVGGAVRIGGAWKIDKQEELSKAVALAKEADQVIICAGLNEDWEAEGHDREDMRLPPGGSDELIAALSQANPNTVVVIQSGAPVEMPWLSSVNGLVQAWYGGNETGNGIADILFGDVCPSGKLPVSFPKRAEDNPAFLNSRCEGGRMLYGEDVYVGYRYYDTIKKEVNFPFGFGLSYTKFETSDLKVNLVDKEELKVSVQVANVGDRDGLSTVQVYVSPVKPLVRRPPRELKGFAKAEVKKGEVKSVEVSIPTKYAVSYFDENRNQWISEKGEYHVLVRDGSLMEEDDKSLKGSFEISDTTWWSGI